MAKRFDPVAFVFGMVFVAIGAVGLLGTTQLQTLNLAQFGAVVLIITGAALLFTTAKTKTG